MWLTRDKLAVKYEGTLPSSAWVDEKIAEAERLLAAELPGIEQVVGYDDLIADVVAAAVLRVVRRPGGVKAENSGPNGYSVDTNVEGGGLRYLVSELALFDKIMDATDSAAFEIVLG